jgi:hypothetical protein
MRSSRRWLVAALLAATGVARLVVAHHSEAVVIHEIHYDPVEGPNLEFVELHNPATQAVDLSGWSFQDGIGYEFAPGVVIPGGGFVVVCRNRIGVSRRFGIPIDRLLGDYLGSLDSAGERLELVDATGRTIDAVEYDDQPPWDSAASGTGRSLERLCASFDSQHPANWVASGGGGAEGGEPSPLAPNHRTACPPPISGTPPVAIHEIFYHPPGEREEVLEFIELANTTSEPVSLRGWFFTDGIQFIFEDDTTLGPGEFVAVCRDQEAVRSAFGIENTVGDFEGQLSNDGERITLIDADGVLVDSVRYGERGDWPVAADGLRHSLEKMVAAGPSDDPRSWAESRPPDPSRWTAVEVSGRATSSRLLLYNTGAGEFLIDNVSLVRTDEPSVELIPSGTFDAGIEGWEVRGNHETSTWSPGGDAGAGGPDGSGALHLIATGRGTGRTQGISLEILPALDLSPQVTYRLRFEYRHLAGEVGLLVRISGASSLNGIYWRYGEGTIASPGRSNGNRRGVHGADVAALPPFVDRVHRFPKEPTSADPVAVTARVRGEGLESVTLLVRVDDGAAVELEMLDDGLAGDGAAGDGVFGVEVPPQLHGSQVFFSVRARSATGGERLFPPASDPAGSYGYYVNDDQPESNLPVYTIIYQPGSTLTERALIAALDCSTYRPCGFAVGGDLYPNCGIRRRGQSVCGDTDVIKKFLKLRFPKGSEFKDVRKLNLQSLWTDKSLIREHMAWKNFAELGAPYCFHNFVRLHVNGDYFGLYAELEHPGKRFLERNGLNGEGNLYKAVASREERDGQYEKKTNEDGDFSDLRDFLNALHNTNGAALVSFFHTRTDEDAIIDYQVAQVLPNNRDYPHKNHYLFHDLETDKWMPMTWDMDLTYGKRWDGNFEGVLNDLMDNPGIDPWYTTNVAGGGTGNHLLDRFFFNAGTYYRRAYLVRLWDALHEKYTTEFYEGRIAGLRELIFAEQEEDIAAWGRSRPSANDPRAPAEFDPNLDRVREHLRIRRSFLINYLRNSHRFTGHPRIKITEVMYNPPGSAEDGEFLELWNNSGEAIDVSGWTITGLAARGDDGTRVEFAFPQGTTIAAGEVVVVAKDPFAFRLLHGNAVRLLGPYSGNLSNEGEDIRVKDAGPEFPATVDWLRYSSRHPWPRRADGLGYSLELTQVSADRDNDLPENWRSSTERGGSPGRIEGVTTERVLFTRGDCMPDGRLNVSDAVALLLHLFGGREIGCRDACDADATQGLNLSDAVFLLDYLFGRGTDLLPAPGPGACGPATGECAESNCPQGA